MDGNNRIQQVNPGSRRRAAWLPTDDPLGHRPRGALTSMRNAMIPRQVPLLQPQHKIRALASCILNIVSVDGSTI
ncbi:hypothetical protein OK016_09605 [Vibrio chagasii]|nr:hypothetical protein [Vibrio chagasii]